MNAYDKNFALENENVLWQMLIFGIHSKTHCYETMKHNYFYLVIILLVLFNGTSTIVAQVSEGQAKNPFPLSEKKIQRLLDNSRRTTERLCVQYPDSNLSTWSEAERSKYLRAKATKVVLLFAPNFYREYKTGIIRKFTNRDGVQNRNDLPYYSFMI